MSPFDPSPPQRSPWPSPTLPSFAEAAAASRSELGGKGWNLALAAQFGMPVPPGFCIPARHFREHLEHNAIALDMAVLLSDNAKAEESADRIRCGTLPSGLAEAIVAAYRALPHRDVAVRSSATDEDGERQAFAGQHSSFLHVRDEAELLRRVKDCWASLLGTAALAYRLRHGGAAQPPQMAVVVQCMVPADGAGVAFARHPNGAEDEMLVEACLGLGAGLVDGRADCDAYTLDAVGLALRAQQVREKRSALRWDPLKRAVTEQAPAPELRCAPVLDAARLLEVGRLLQRCNRHFGGPQDIEWALHEGRIWLLQSRPITEQAEAPEPLSPRLGPPLPGIDEHVIWSRMDVGEIFTGRMTPLGLSFARHYQYRVHGECGIGVGLLDVGDPDHYMGSLRGHIYLNVSYSAYMLAQTPAGFDQRPFLQRFSSEEIDLTGYRNPHGERYASERYSLWRTSAWWLWRTGAELLQAHSRARRMERSRLAEYDRALGMHLPSLTHARLGEELAHALAYFKAMHVGYLPYYINAFALYGLLEELCKVWLPGDGPHLQNRLKGDMSQLRTLQSARELWQLARSLDRYPRAKEIVRTTAPQDLLAQLGREAQGKAFLNQEFAAFMRENGVRASEEMELTHPRWVDDPAYVFQMLRTYLDKGDVVARRMQGASTAQDGDAQALLAKLPWHRRAVVRRVISMFGGCSRLREEARMAMITSIWLVRRVVFELARRLQTQGVLHDADEIAWLDFDALCRYAQGDADAAACFPRAAIDAARRRYKRWLREPDPPLTFIGALREAVPAAAPVKDACTLQGLGTSRGRVRARARVIDDLRCQAGELQEGEIIVTRFTDASWTPLFALAGGVVTDLGSMLSHSSIVAREFGLPAVVNTQTATARIRTGDWLVLDGEAGTVQLPDDNKGPSAP